jgi:hypothetical protein
MSKPDVCYLLCVVVSLPNHKCLQRAWNYLGVSRLPLRRRLRLANPYFDSAREKEKKKFVIPESVEHTYFEDLAILD